MIARSAREENGCVAGKRRIFDEKFAADLYNPSHSVYDKPHRKLIYDPGFTGTDL
ncbi:hypothetical protein Rahaq2_3364 [Rahnella aquatilis CIP 78.65 = ATCC 33071]|uniref:Uncharacterized protein n=1 Tax=Rahnella aquatilis (strain ATCC 33071 / DSM 4594 / JCM 1683 / NBRC 105701 / NCIMB 13365 / CIP 78.65) TaxID=745277 RepID=H2IYV3_RAHAC|nr:hypothetical protein Rahaq2_3364 [Rahnella aquatilis CIP 78.65 = ATCC 33071]